MGIEMEDDPRSHSVITWIEGTLILVTAPLLTFPTVRPRWTALALGALAAVWLLRWVLCREPWPLAPFNGALLLFALTIPVAIRVSVTPEFAVPKACGLLLGLATFREIAWVARSPRGLKGALVLFCLLGVGILMVGGIAAKWPAKVDFLAPYVSRLPQQQIRLPELAAEAVHPNQIAGTLSLYVPLALSLAFGWPYGRHALRQLPALLLGLLLLVGMGGALVLTQSRSGWMGGVMGVATVLALWDGVLPRSSWRKWALWGILVLLTTLLSLWMIHIGPQGLSRLWEDPAEATVVGSLGTLVFRQEVWRWALYAIQDFPLTGCGLGAFRRMARILYPLDPLRVSPNYDIAHAHNIFLQTALDLGIPGLVAYLALLMVALALCWREAKRQSGFPRAVALGLAGGLIALHAYGMTDALALGSKPAVIFWYALGLLAALKGMGRDD